MIKFSGFDVIHEERESADQDALPVVAVALRTEVVVVPPSKTKLQDA